MISIRRAVLASGFIIFLIVLIHSSRTSTSRISQLAQKSASRLSRTTQQHPPSEKEQRTQDEASSPSTATPQLPLPPKPRRRPTPQKPLALPSNATLLSKLMYNFHYDPLPTFPAYIWQTWKVSPSAGSFEEKFRPYEASWTNKHPSFIHEVITDDIAPTLIGYLYAGVPEVAEAYNALPFAILKADFFRYLILLARGGIYSDIDTSALKSSVDWIPEPFVPHSGLVIGIEADPDREDWKTWYSRRVQFCQWTIMAKPGHPVLAHVVADITLKTLTRLRNKTLSRLTQAEIVDFTGPALWTDRIFDYMNDETYFDLSGALTGVAPKGNITWANFTGMKEPRLVGDVVVLPITSFSPGVQAMGAGEDDDPMAFVKHEFEGSWKPESERHIGEQKGKWR